MQVAALGRAVLDGMASAGVVGIIKHMPGHGRALVDSHHELPIVTASTAELETDLEPFERLASAPDVPTVDEAGLRGFYFLNWHAIWAPRGVSADVAARLNAAVRAVLADQRSLKRLAEIGQQVPTLEQETPQALANYQKEEIARWWPVIKAANIKGE